MEIIHGFEVTSAHEALEEHVRGIPPFKRRRVGHPSPFSGSTKMPAPAKLGRGTLETRYVFDSGNSRTRFPVAAKIALHTAGANGGTPGSPTPAGGASLSTMYTLVL